MWYALACVDGGGVSEENTMVGLSQRQVLDVWAERGVAIVVYDCSEQQIVRFVGLHTSSPILTWRAYCAVSMGEQKLGWNRKSWIQGFQCSWHHHM